LYHGKSYDNKIQLLSELVKNLNEALSTENASVDRIISRIDQTPIQEVKQRLKTHLKEARIQKSRLRRIIRRLGEKLTDAKADLSLSFVSDTMPMGNNFPKTVKSKTENNGLENSAPEEYELVQMINMRRQHENISLLEKSMQQEESMVYWYKIHTPLILDNLWPRMIHTSIRRGQNFLLKHTSFKIPLIIIYADLVG